MHRPFVEANICATLNVCRHKFDGVLIHQRTMGHKFFSLYGMAAHKFDVVCIEVRKPIHQFLLRVLYRHLAVDSSMRYSQTYRIHDSYNSCFSLCRNLIEFYGCFTERCCINVHVWHVMDFV